MGTAPLAGRGMLRRAVDDTVDRIRRRGRTAVFRAARLTGAAVLSYVVALLFHPQYPPLLAPLTALLVVQVTLASTLDHGIERVVSVVAGVVLAMLFAGVVGLTWWSLGLLVATSIVLGQLLRLGPHLLEVPISAMLVLGVASNLDAAESAAVGRAAETLVGAVVGFLVNLAFPPAVRTIDASTAVLGFAERVAGLLDRASQELARGAGPEQAARWMEEARSFGRHVTTVDDALGRAEEGRRLNLRALGTPEVEVSLRKGFDALEHSSVAVRTMFRSILDGMQRSLGPEAAGEYAAEVRGAFSVLLDDLAITVRAYGRLVAAELEEDTDREEAELATALEALREARARVSDMLLLGPRDDPQYWELNVSLLATVERLLLELDVEERARQHARRVAEGGESAGAAHLAERIRATTRQLGETSRQLSGLRPFRWRARRRRGAPRRPARERRRS